MRIILHDTLGTTWLKNNKLFQRTKRIMYSVPLPVKLHSRKKVHALLYCENEEARFVPDPGAWPCSPLSEGNEKESNFTE